MDVMMKGKPLTTNSTVPVKGEQAPDFSLNDLNEKAISLSDYKGEVVLISTFPDINTSTCSRQTAKFNEMARTLDSTRILSISTNTKEEQKDWCSAKEIDKTARAVFVLNREGQIVYREVVKEMSQDPNYEEAIAAARHEEAEMT
ncbi:Thiol peroxidase, Tpx-type [Marinilactibacillus psychrotolerans 42ea]|uniref:Thiol peroxidase, Tpx-type n=1 Tax=Marinilactibacillus psychrotolerans 42ea TaxID=1255609 RepID=A0A1R4ICM8_9LACT|nr:redoxin domain-containing protein [Marinilactibacillus psychrotolerans]SJN17595.1 Thiol peroxidase, Tpx-type [Marinilactibacillus psychrotolerans 42ea]